MIIGLFIFVLVLVLVCVRLCRWSYQNGRADATRSAERHIPPAPLTLVHPVEQPGMPKLIEPDPLDKPVSGHIIFTKNLPRKRGRHGRFVKKTN